MIIRCIYEDLELIIYFNLYFYIIIDVSKKYFSIELVSKKYLALSMVYFLKSLVK
jgi:hypothetical protein